MIPSAFEYHAPKTLDEALRLVERHGDEAKLLAGGHSLLPLMKLRLAAPRYVIDIGHLRGMSYIREENGMIAIGALTTHADIEQSALLASTCPLLPETAAQIGDVQVRNRGTIGGSLAHADPGADYPTVITALGGTVVVQGTGGERDSVETHREPGNAQRPARGRACLELKPQQPGEGQRRHRPQEQRHALGHDARKHPGRHREHHDAEELLDEVHPGAGLRQELPGGGADDQKRRPHADAHGKEGGSSAGHLTALADDEERGDQRRTYARRDDERRERTHDRHATQGAGGLAIAEVGDPGLDRDFGAEDACKFVKQLVKGDTPFARAVALSPDQEQQFLYVASRSPARLWILDRKTLEPLDSFGRNGVAPGEFYVMHHMNVDAKGNLYVTEVQDGKRIQKFVFKGLVPAPTH